MKKLILFLAAFASTANASGADDISGRYNLVSSNCLDTTNGSLYPATVTKKVELNIGRQSVLKNSSESAYRANIKIGETEIEGFLATKTLAPSTISATYSASGASFLITYAHRSLTVVEPIVLKDGACKSGHTNVAVYRAL